VENQELIQEVEQNANIIYEHVRKVVANMNPSISAVTLAFSELFREATCMLITADWTEGQRQLYSDLVDQLVNQKLGDAFAQAMQEGGYIANPPVSADAFLIETGDELKH